MGVVVSGSVGAFPDMGLSLSHICTRAPDGAPVDGDGGPVGAAAPHREDECSVSVWDGGSLVRVHTPIGRHGGARRGEVAADDVGADTEEDAEQPGPRSGAGRRGKVKGFSRASRLRLLELVSKLEQEAATHSLFVTLTLSDDCDTSGRALKAYLRRFKARVSRRFPRAALIWRLEVVERKSGKHVGLPFGHFHVLLFGVPDAPGLRDWLSHTWYECVGSGDRKHLLAGTNVQAARDWGSVRRYAAKQLYAAKPGDNALAVAIPDIGRFWGVLSAELLPMAREVVRWLTPREAFRLLRILRRYVRSVWRKRKRPPPPSVYRWRSFFVEDGSQWAERLGVVGYLV